MLRDSEILAVGTGWSHDFQSLFLFTQMQKKDSIDSLLSFFMVGLTKLLCNPSTRKQYVLDLTQKPLALTSTAKRCALQLLDSLFSVARIYSIFHQTIFQVNPMKITFLVELEI